MERTDGGMPIPLCEVAVASFIGTTVEWYDYFNYGTAAALVFPALFFPGLGGTTGTILSYTTSAVGFLARPLNGLVFGQQQRRA